MPMLTGPAVVRIAPFAAYILFLAFDATISPWVMGMGLDARWLYACRVGAVALLLAGFWRSYAELAWPADVPARMWAVSLFAGLAVFALWVMPYPAWATLGGASAGFSPLRADGSIDPLLAAVRISGAALVVPVMEELFWRSYLMRWLENAGFMAVDPARIGLRALVFTAALFAVEHDLWLAGLLAGLVYGWLYIISRNLWVPVLAHAVTNGVLGFWVLHTGVWRYW